MSVTREQVEAGQAVYTPKMLGFYDFLILRIIVPYIWKCPIGSRITLYNANITSNHLEVGVGSGFYLEHTIFPNNHPRLALMDLNPNCLKHTSERLSRYSPEVYRANILEPIELDIEKFDSIALNAVIHCLPGTMQSKLIVFDHLKKLLNPGGVIFGSTVLNIGVEKNWITNWFMKYYNDRQIFTNLNDDLATLEKGLSERFSQVELNVTGTVAIFKAVL